MRSAGSSTSDQQLLDIVMGAASRVLGIPGIRPDTPLIAMGYDSVARLCVADLVEESLAARGLVHDVDDAALVRATTCQEIADAMRCRS